MEQQRSGIPGTMMALHSRFEQELLETHSLGALCKLISYGRKVELRVGEISCFLTSHPMGQTVSLWADGTAQVFDTMDQLLCTAQIKDSAFLNLWTDAVITTIF